MFVNWRSCLGYWNADWFNLRKTENNVIADGQSFLTTIVGIFCIGGMIIIDPFYLGKIATITSTYSKCTKQY